METSIIVKNISDQLKEHHLRELFECCGPIIALKFSDSEPRYCSITYKDPSHAKAAIFLSGTPLGDLELNVALQTSPSIPKPVSAQSGGASLQLLNNAVQAIAAGSTAAQMQMTKNALSVATAGLSALSGPLLEAAHKRMDEVARTIYVGNINCLVTEDKLKSLFDPCGEIAFVKMAGDTIGKPSRFGFIEFKTKEAAAAAFALNGTMLAGFPVKVGKALNPIPKPSIQKMQTQKEKLAAIMMRVRAATDKIDRKVNNPGIRFAISPGRSPQRKKKRPSRSRSSERKRKESDRKQNRPRKTNINRSRDQRRSLSRSRDQRRSSSRSRNQRRSRSRSRSRKRRRSRKSRYRETYRRRGRSKSPSKNRNKSRSKRWKKSRSKSQSRSRNKSRNKSRSKDRSKDRRKSRSKSRSKGRSKSRSKSRRQGRSKSRSKDRSKYQSKNQYKRRSKSRSKSRSKTLTKNEKVDDNVEKKSIPDRSGQVFNGHCLQPTDKHDANPENINAKTNTGITPNPTLMAQQTALYSQQQQFQPHLQSQQQSQYQHQNLQQQLSQYQNY